MEDFPAPDPCGERRRMNMALDMRFDRRIVERNIQKGRITEKEYQKHLDSLPDVEKKGEVVDLEQPLFAEPEEDGDGE